MIEIRFQVQNELDLTPEVKGFISDIAEAYPIITREEVDKSTPRGRIYRRGAITGRRTQAGLKMGLKLRGKSRMAIGSRFHRASAPGQMWAKDSGEMYRKIRVKDSGEFSKTVVFEAPHAGYVERQRPFAVRIAELAVQRVLR